jgi:hypothetical protein
LIGGSVRLGRVAERGSREREVKAENIHVKILNILYQHPELSRSTRVAN